MVGARLDFLHSWQAVDFSPHFSQWPQTHVREVLPDMGYSEARKLRTKRLGNLFFGKQEKLD